MTGIDSVFATFSELPFFQETLNACNRGGFWDFFFNPIFSTKPHFCYRNAVFLFLCRSAPAYARCRQFCVGCNICNIYYNFVLDSTSSPDLMRNYQSCTDEELFDLLSADDEKSFETIYNRYWEQLFG